ncbi:heavy-metal-associated domain-containing protein [Flavisphingopyxis soli]|uniref:heavy-metal-associated domain-containing protein n=1 Tax=Flavisphingopyxis soli TaxID=2601267 RepID=UPI001F24FC67|nr:heavy-metal-associated domain-containing protein [Sphingorhabdus soli]
MTSLLSTPLAATAGQTGRLGAFSRNRRALAVALGALALLLAVAAWAQIAGDRGIAPINSSADFAVEGIFVDTTGKTAIEARDKGWREAQRLGWEKLFKQTHAGAAAPKLDDSALDGIVSAIVVEHEQIGPGRYIATLGVQFDRARAGQILGVSGQIRRSPPLLVIPMTWIGNMPQVFESRTDWQRAWARFRTSESAIDYVRTDGSGIDTLLLDAGQTGRRSRIWWRAILDQYGAADVLIPSARLEFAWPGGPVTGHFAARHGPDNVLIDSFVLKVDSADKIPAMMAAAVARIDKIYVSALASGLLKADASLIVEKPVEAKDVPEAKEETPADGATTGPGTADSPSGDTPAPPPAANLTSFNIQFDSPDAAAVLATERAVASAAGVASATTTSVALGGTSIMRVGYRGDLAGLRAALQSRGFTVQEGGGTLRISRGGR